MDDKARETIAELTDAAEQGSARIMLVDHGDGTVFYAVGETATLLAMLCSAMVRTFLKIGNKKARTAVFNSLQKAMRKDLKDNERNS